MDLLPQHRIFGLGIGQFLGLFAKSQPGRKAPLYAGLIGSPHCRSGGATVRVDDVLISCVLVQMEGAKKPRRDRLRDHAHQPYE